MRGRVSFKSSYRVRHPVSPTQRLEDLGDLYKRGLITKDEYDSKRAEILRGM
jgi:hypothetical protein